MYEPSFIKRLSEMGIGRFIKSYDTIAGVLATAIVFIAANGSISENTASPLLGSFVTVSATLFAIVLTGFTIITSFTDKTFLYTWKKVGNFEELVTFFQYNLTIPIVVLLYSIILYINYNGKLMILLIGIFVYFLVSLLNLMALISRYALQRGEFIKQEIEAPEHPNDLPDKRLSNEELAKIERLVEQNTEEE